MGILRKIKRAVRGEVKPKTVMLEALRRTRAVHQIRSERANLDRLNTEMPKLWFGKHDDPLKHFRTRVEPHFFAGFSSPETGNLQTQLFPADTDQLLSSAHQILENHNWPILGFGNKNFGEQIEWRRDFLSGYLWPLDYHRDLKLIRNDGSDVRVLWEVNRLGHLITLSRAYKVFGDEKFAREVITQLKSWANDNPYGRGVNWTCAMEAALRVMNLIAVFELLKTSSLFDQEALSLFLKLFHQHGTYITTNLEFTHISTSNHYLSDLTGILWLGIMLPEFVDSEYYFDFGFVGLLEEMDKQILPDGADFESSTGYHRFVLELFLYSFILCKQNDLQVDIEEKYWEKLRLMLEYLRGYLRPDGLAPLIGDSDGGQVLPISTRRANDHEYLLAVGAAILGDQRLRTKEGLTPEVLWLLGPSGIADLQNLVPDRVRKSQSFPYAGTYIMLKGDRYLCFNASGAGLNGRGSHGHNDAMSIEVNAGGRAFIVDPGTCVYTGDLKQRHLFRSTAYHSTAKIDDEEQNQTLESVPFVIGNEAHPTVLEWHSDEIEDRVVAEHSGYKRLSSPIVHRRTVVFSKTEGSWLIEDEFFSEGNHEFDVRFHFAPGLETIVNQSSVNVCDQKHCLSVTLVDRNAAPTLETQACSVDYGEILESTTACWHFSGKPGKLSWRIEVVGSDHVPFKEDL